MMTLTLTSHLNKIARKTGRELKIDIKYRILPSKGTFRSWMHLIGNNVSISSEMPDNTILRGIAYLLLPIKSLIEAKSNKYNAFLYLGGDVFSDYYFGIDTLSDFVSFKFLHLAGKDAILPGHTVGPFSSWKRVVAKFCLKDTIIFSRDRWSYKYLISDLKLDPQKVRSSADLAFLPLPNQYNHEYIKKVLRRYKLREDRYITIVPSGLWWKYTNRYDKYVENWVRLINKLEEHPDLFSMKIVLLSHVLDRPELSDSALITEISKKLKAKNKRSIVQITEPIPPTDARIILGNGIFTITGRMHAAISTFQMGKPAISLSYSAKYKGIIGYELNLEDLIIDARGDKIWENGKIITAILNRVEYTLDNYSKLTRKIKFYTRLQCEKAHDMIRDIINHMG